MEIEKPKTFPFTDNKKHIIKTVYIPAREINLFRIIEVLWKTQYGNFNLSEFLRFCAKEYINNLSKEDKKTFEECALKLSKINSPSTSNYVEKFLKDNPKK